MDDLDFIKTTGNVSNTERLLVHRYTILENFVNRLKINYPGIWKLLGETCARGAALAYSHKLNNITSRGGEVNKFGANFAVHLESFPSTLELTYLPDFARLEWLRSVSAEAKNEITIAPDKLAKMNPDKLEKYQLIFNSSLSNFAAVYVFSLLVLFMRIWIAKIFWYSGLTKISSFDSTIYLFEYEYKVPLISPEIAAYLATTIELSMPSFLVLGLFSRLACLPLIAMTLVIQLTYLELPEHLYWLFLLSTVLLYGPAQATEQSTTNVSTTNSAVSAAPTPEIIKEVRITDSWARKSISPNNNSAAYMKISNPTDKDIVIIGASASETANNVELHKSFVDEKGVSRMTSIDKIVVPAKTDIELAPGAIHVMLFDLKKSLNTGDKFNIEVKIEGKTPIVVQTEVKYY
ncbi:unnamed protein product [Rotaria magnacalcarata]|uniref:Copper chaperone PCu(A)C n=1 Tax=Rotaria magnacalcarata TaxID=392030 RepID=A0A816NAC0_9BILA|nr:unnamed protein product [Rotaria magnacalcarata]